MKLRITMIDWKYPDDGKTPSPEVLDLAVFPSSGYFQSMIVKLNPV